jgi:hypothetical protein
MPEQCTLTTTAASSSKLLMLRGIEWSVVCRSRVWDAGYFNSATSGKILGNYFELHYFRFLQCLLQIITSNYPVI